MIRTPVARQASVLLASALTAFIAANLIHNRFGLDPAVLPAGILAAAYWWRRHRALLWGAAALVALPAFAFLNWAALGRPGDPVHFANHVALLAAGACAAGSVLASLVPARPRAS